MWCAAEDVYPGRRFLDYALPGDEIVIGDQKVALPYKEWLADLGVSVSMPKSLVSDICVLEFAKKFRVKGVHLSPINIKMISAPRVSKLCCQSHDATLVYDGTP